MNDSNQILVLRDNAKHELMQIKSVEEGITYLNKLKSIEVWVSAEKKDAELQNIIAEQKLRTQRILGELIAEGQRKGTIATPGGNGNNQYANVPKENNSKLEDIGINRKQSSTFQAIASIPEDDFEGFIHEKKQAVNNAVAELTTTGAVRLAKSLNNNSSQKINNENAIHAYDEEVKELIARINSLPIFYRIKIKRAIKRGK
jgi:hypothetical protein